MAIELAQTCRGFSLSPNVRHAALYPAQRHEAGTGLMADDAGQGGFAHTWWPIEQDGGEEIRQDRATQQSPFSQNVRLPGVFC